jgi:hypothetical protein
MSVVEPQPIVPKPKLRWYQFSLRSLLIATAVLAFLLGMAIHFRTHLYVRYVTAREEKFADVKAIPASPMPDTPEPKDWVRCHFGSLQFSLPPAMAGNVESPKNGASFRAFRDGSKSVIVELPTGISETDDFLKTGLKLPPQGQGLSRPRLRLACCQVNAADFRWTMSQDEVRWYAWRVAMNRLFCLESDGWAETMFGTDLDGILLFGGSHLHATFDWQDKNKAVAGFVYFQDKSSDLDPTWVRSVCKSVQVCQEPHSGEPSARRPLAKRDLLASLEEVTLGTISFGDLTKEFGPAVWDSATQPQFRPMSTVRYAESRLKVGGSVSHPDFTHASRVVYWKSPLWDGNGDVEVVGLIFENGEPATVFQARILPH